MAKQAVGGRVACMEQNHTRSGMQAVVADKRSAPICVIQSGHGRKRVRRLGGIKRRTKFSKRSVGRTLSQRRVEERGDSRLSEQAIRSGEPAKEQQTKRPSFKEILQAIKDNFVLVSATAALIGVALAMTFLSSYLWVFDWHLIWFIQYTDIITFGLIAIGIISGSVALLQSSTMTVIEALGMKGWSRFLWIIVIVVLMISLTVSSMRDAVERSEGYRHIISGTFAFLGGDLSDRNDGKVCPER
jgi:hypothetical protein